MKLSLIIPTYNERDNIFTVTDLVGRALQTVDYEIIFVDDSADDTPDMLRQAAEVDRRVRYEHRTHERGLGTAVVRGFELATGDVLAVMDADLQHPPEMLVTMFNEIENGSDIVVPSRFVPGGDDGGLSSVRKLISAGARHLARLALHRVRKTTDPTSGFFMMRHSVIEGVKLRPIGWKILIEVLARGTYTSILEIPYAFRARSAGESKMSVREQWNYIKHLGLLVRDSPTDRRFFLFAGVGISGVLVNMVVYIIAVRLGLTVMVAGLVSALAALLSNFTLNDRLTWSDVKGQGWLMRASKYFLTSLVGIGIDVGILTVLYHDVHIHYVAANLAGIIVATIWNYAVSNYWTWRTAKRKIIITVSEQVSKSA